MLSPKSTKLLHIRMQYPDTILPHSQLSLNQYKESCDDASGGKKRKVKEKKESKSKKQKVNQKKESCDDASGGKKRKAKEKKESKSKKQRKKDDSDDEDDDDDDTEIDEIIDNSNIIEQRKIIQSALPLSIKEQNLLKLKNYTIRKYDKNKYDLYCLISKDSIIVLKKVLDSFIKCNSDGILINFDKEYIMLYNQTKSKSSDNRVSFKISIFCDDYKLNTNNINDMNKNEKGVYSISLNTRAFFELTAKSMDSKLNNYFVFCFKYDPNKLDSMYLELIKVKDLNESDYTHVSSRLPAIDLEMNKVELTTSILKNSCHISLKKITIEDIVNELKKYAGKESIIKMKINESKFIIGLGEEEYYTNIEKKLTNYVEDMNNNNDIINPLSKKDYNLSVIETCNVLYLFDTFEIFFPIVGLFENVNIYVLDSKNGFVMICENDIIQYMCIMSSLIESK